METKDDTKIASPITFQPMPKRFMVWDKVGKQFLRKRLPDGIDMVFSIFELPLEIDCLDEEEKKQFIVCQSTNLFDKDGREIIEGHIVRVGSETGVVQMVNGEWHAVGDDDMPLSVWKPSGIEIIGHILSNPELLGEK